MVNYFILGVTFAFAAAVQPGPLQAYLVSQTLSAGWRRTLLAAFSPLLSDGPIILLVVILLSQVPAGFVQALQIIGGLFLIYLAYGAYQAYKKYQPEKVLEPKSGQQTLLKAALVNLLNPNPYLAWSLVMGPLLIKAWRETPLNGIALLVSFYSTMILGLLGTVLLISAARSLGTRINRGLILLSSAALAVFALYELWTGINSIL